MRLANLGTTFVLLQYKDREGEIIIRLHNIYLLRRLNSFPEVKNPFSTEKKIVPKAYFFIIRFKIMINQNQNQNLRMEGGTDRQSGQKLPS